MPSWWQSLVNCLAKSTRIPLLTTGSVSDHEERQPLPPVRRPQPLQPNIGQARGRPVAQGFGKCGTVGARQNDDGESYGRDADHDLHAQASVARAGILPRGGILRLYGRAKIHKSGPVYEEIWNRLIEPEKKGDPEKKGYAVLVTIERAEDLSGQPLT
jgi:hypothetical protein